MAACWGQVMTWVAEPIVPFCTTCWNMTSNLASGQRSYVRTAPRSQILQKTKQFVGMGRSGMQFLSVQPSVPAECLVPGGSKKPRCSALRDTSAVLRSGGVPVAAVLVHRLWHHPSVGVHCAAWRQLIPSSKKKPRAPR